MDFDTGARMRAARHLAGFRKVETLASAIDQKGLGTTVLREIERGEHPAQFSDLQEIAYHCRVPVEWFTADFSRLPEISADPRRVIAARQAASAESAAPAPPGELHRELSDDRPSGGSRHQSEHHRAEGSEPGNGR